MTDDELLAGVMRRLLTVEHHGRNYVGLLDESEMIVDAWINITADEYAALRRAQQANPEPA